MLDTVPCAVQSDLVAYPFYVEKCVSNSEYLGLHPEAGRENSCPAVSQVSASKCASQAIAVGFLWRAASRAESTGCFVPPSWLQWDSGFGFLPFKQKEPHGGQRQAGRPSGRASINSLT